MVTLMCVMLLESEEAWSDEGAGADAGSIHMGANEDILVCPHVNGPASAPGEGEVKAKGIMPEHFTTF